MASSLDQYSNQTQAAIKNAGLDSVMGLVNSGASISDISKIATSTDENGNSTSNFNPVSVSSYKDASGNTVKAPANTYVVSNYDGSGGRLNYFFTIDPKTGKTQSISDPTQNLTYTGGVNGGFVNNAITGIDSLASAMGPAMALIPGAAPVLAGLNAAHSLVNGKLDTSTILNGITAAAGLGNQLGFDPSTISDLSTAKNVASGINAVQKGNIAGVISSLNSLTDILPAGTPQAINVINGIAALKKGDTAGALSALSSLTESPDIKVASQATNIIKSLTSNGQTPIQSGIATPAAQTTGSAPSVLQGIASPQTEVTAGQMIDQNIFGLVNPYTQFNEAQKTALAKGLPSLLGG